ncbi:MAG: DNA polymerase III subunit beta [Proteobacteria bacterium]|nr:DNA polymerase III subunit beta [Pseudomonadota bacterium]
MEFAIQKRVFLDALGKVQGICGRKTNFPITGNILLTAEAGGLTLMATDLEVGFSGEYPAEVTAPGSATIPGKKLFEIVREFPSEVVRCRELENGWIEIADGAVQFHVVGMDPDEFPALPDLSQTDTFTLESVDLLDMVEKVNLSGNVGSEEKRPHLVGILLQKVEKEGENRLRMVSTDGHRLSMVDYLAGETDPAAALGAPEGVILPKKILPEIQKVLEDEGPVSLGVRGNYFMLVKGSETLVCRLVEGRYPDYNMVIPPGIETFFKVERELFLPTLKRMSILASDKYKAVRFKVGNEYLTVTMANPDIGESKETMVISFDGVPFEVAFNPRFFVDAIGPMASESILIRIKDDERACILEGQDDPGYLAVIMPMKLES